MTSSDCWKPHEEWPLIGPRGMKKKREESAELIEDAELELTEDERAVLTRGNLPDPTFSRASFSNLDNVNIKLKRSLLPGAGYGLFALRSYYSGEPITIYEGEVISWREARNREQLEEDSHIVSHIPLAWQIDGAKVVRTHNATWNAAENKVVYTNADGTPAVIADLTAPVAQLRGIGAAAMTNDARDPAKTNAIFDFVDSDVNKAILQRILPPTFSGEQLLPLERITFIRAKRTILTGEEIYVDYGRRYWEKFEARQKKKRRQTENED
jgi:hypothetical protein